MEHPIQWLDSISQDDAERVGSKGANLGELRGIGVRVPNGFCLTVDAYRAFLAANDIAPLIEEQLAILAALDAPDTTAECEGAEDAAMEEPEEDPAAVIERVSETLKGAINDGQLPEALVSALQYAYERLIGARARSGESGVENERGDENEPSASAGVELAVRSSALMEDLPTASFAGQLDTVLNIRSVPALIASIKKCWASVWNVRAINYRDLRGIGHTALGVAVVVQKMVQAEVAGVCFTTNPITLRDDIVIDAVYGLGEALVGGEVTPDSYVVDRNTGEIVWRQCGTKHMKLVRDDERGAEGDETGEGCTTRVSVPDEDAARFTLTDAQVKRLLAAALEIEAHFGAPQDIEWSLADERFFFLQTRPITTLSLETQVPAVKGEWSRSPLDERILTPLTPWEQAILERTIPLVHAALESFGLSIPSDRRVIRIFYGRPYMNRSLFEQMLSVMPEVVEMFFHNRRRHRKAAIKPKLHPLTIRIGINLLYHVDRVHRRWYAYLRTFKPAVRAIEVRDLDAMSAKERLDQLDELETLALGAAKIHFQSITFAEFLYQILDQSVQYFLDTRDENLAAKLIAGIPGNKTVETNTALWELASAARKRPAVAQYLSTVALDETSMIDIRDTLAHLDAGGTFLLALDRFLDRYGHRTPVYSFLHPSWGEDPRQVLELVRSYLEYGDSHNPAQHEREQVRRRREATAFVQQRLTHGLRGLIPFQRTAFRILLKLTHAYARLRENQQFYVGMTFPLVRQTMLAVGKELVDAGVVDEPIQGFFFETAELRAFFAKKTDAETLRQRFEKRHEEYERYCDFAAPNMIGGASAAPMGVELLSGVGVSAGMASGTAKVVRGPDEFAKIKRGDILVAHTTTPTWTPLFVMARGLVTDIGGTLSHGAVVSREYGIPAVMGTGNATELLSDGDRIVVDGDRGMVWRGTKEE